MRDGNVNDGAVHSAWLAKIQTETSRGRHGTAGWGVDPWNAGVCIKTCSLEGSESHLLLLFP